MKKVLYAVAALALPVVSFAQSTSGLEAQPGIGRIATLFKNVIGYAAPILVSVAVVYFLYGVVMYVIAADPEKKDGAKSTMIYGVIGIFVMVSVYGLVGLIGETLQVEQGGTVETPTLPFND